MVGNLNDVTWSRAAPLAVARCQVTADPVSGTPLIIPVGRHHGTVSADRSTSR
jgi:iron complex transport system ATP-binding protein